MYTSVCDLINGLQEDWSKIAINTLLNLVDNLLEELKLLQLQSVDQHQIYTVQFQFIEQTDVLLETE